MKTKVYIVRHGFSEGNYLHRFYGHYNGSLMPEGYAQASQLAEYFVDIPVDAIYSSDLLRAYNTILPTALLKKIEVIKDARLREINGGKWENMPVEEVRSQYPAEFDCWKHNKSESRCPGGESVRELQKRIFDAVNDIAQQNAGKSVIICTHGTPIWTLTASLQNIPLENINGNGWVVNASVTEAETENGKWQITKPAECMVNDENKF